MATDNKTGSSYTFDQEWNADSSWKTDGSGNRDLSWKPSQSWTETASNRVKPGNGGASFAAWNPQTPATEMLVSPQAEQVRTPAPLSPGFYLIPRSMSGDQVLAILFIEKPDANLVSRIKSLNPTFDQGFKAGEMFVLGNLVNPTACLREEADLMNAAAQVRTALEPLSEPEADFMTKHQAEIALMLSGGSDSLGVSKDVFDKGLKIVEGTLHDIEYLHQREFATHGHLQSPEFFQTRKKLLSLLDKQLKLTLLGKQLGLGSYHTLRRDLGISTRSVVHHWSRSGAPNQIPGYATHMREIAKAAKILKGGGHIGMALSVTASGVKIKEVCEAGSATACEKVKYTEAGSLAGGLVIGTASMAIASSSAGSLCAFIGLGTGGVGGVICGLGVIGTVSFFGGKVGSEIGENIGGRIYEEIPQ
ncbi:hypothetical protein WG219_04635 [Ectopseudomonas mendocina]|uniref:LysM domain-containing protein n=1 Tax=Ectopseudomonas mendocina TaxID=300 RepID=A0ABZ2RIE3_ECTME